MPPEVLQRFWWSIWPEAVRDFGLGGIALQTTDGPGEVRRTAADNPFFVGLRRGVINLVLTARLPLYWDGGRALAGVTTIHEGYHVCMIALPYAHGNRTPFLSVNTCVHELLHALLPDVFVAIRSGTSRAAANCASTGMPPGFGYSMTALPSGNRRWNTYAACVAYDHGKVARTKLRTPGGFAI